MGEQCTFPQQIHSVQEQIDSLIEPVKQDLYESFAAQFILDRKLISMIHEQFGQDSPVSLLDGIDLNAEQLLTCLIRYQVATTFASNCKPDHVDLKLKKKEFYSLYLQDAITRTWNIVCKSIGMRPGLMSSKSGLHLMFPGHKQFRNEMTFPHNFQHIKFVDLVQYLQQLAQFIKDNLDSNMKRRAPSKQVLIPKFDNIKGFLNPAAEQIDEESCSDDIVLDNDTEASLNSTSSDDSAIMPDTFEDLVEIVHGVISEDDELCMDWNDQIIFLNSKPVVEQMLKVIIEKMSLDSQPIPLDVCASITPNSSCLTDEGPSVKLYLEMHPEEVHRNITVIVFEDHMSSEFMENCEKNINELQFLVDGQRVLRFATSPIYNPSVPFPMATFGSNPSNRRLYETTTQTEYEGHLMKMGNLVFEWLDEAIRRSNHIFKDCLRNEESKPSFAKEMSDTFCWPVSDSGESLKMPNDSIVWLAANDNSYSLHSDSQPYKNCNHNDAYRHSHHLAMRIFTFAFVSANDGEDDELEYPIATLRHAIISKKEEVVHCKIVGFFCSRENQFVQWTGDNSGIPLGTQCHAHIQMPGSQGSILHGVEMHTKKSYRRIVGSLRTLKPQQPDYKTRHDRVERNIANVHLQDEHFQNYIGSVLSGSHRFFNPIHAEVDASTIDQPSKKSKPSRKPNLPTGIHASNPLFDFEKAKRKCIISTHQSFNESIIARCNIAVEQYMSHETTVIFHISKKLQAIAGPFVYEDETSSTGYRLLQVGADIPGKLLDLSSGIISNKNHHRVVNTSLSDVLHLIRISKNSCRLAETLKNIILNPNEVQLTQIDVRGKGGAITAAGAQKMLSHNKTSIRTAPNYILSRNQDPFSDEAQALVTCVSHQQCVNVFANNTYIGLYYFDEVTHKRCRQNEITEQIERINGCLPTLNQHKPEVYRESAITGGFENASFREIASMRAVSTWGVLTPIDKDQAAHGKTEGKDKEWNVVHLQADDFDIPSIGIGRGKETNVLRLDGGVLDGFSFLECLVEHHPLGFLKEPARKKIMDACSESIHCPDGIFVYRDPENEEQEYPTMFDIYSIAIHSAGVTNAKAFEDEIISSCKLRMNVPRGFLLEDGSFSEEKDKDEYNMRLHDLNLKSLTTRSTHPPTLVYDPTAIIAKHATRSEDPTLQELTEEGKWKYRNGPSYVLVDNSDKAWNKIFQCVVCALIQPSSILFIDHHCKRKMVEEFLLAPIPEQLDAFVETISGLDGCNSRLCHHVVRSVFKDEVQLIRFLYGIKKSGRQIFKAAIRDNLTDKDNYYSFLSRPNVGKSLMRSLNQLGVVKFNSFHIQIIMRTIECCIHEPFGEVISVEGGPGSDDGARCLLHTYKEDVKSFHKRKCQDNCIEDVSSLNLDYLTILLPGWIVEQFNARARKVFSPNENDDGIQSVIDDNVTKDNLLCELSVLGLRWHSDLDCLVHRDGIGKKFDGSDAEHLECDLQHTRQMTLPSQNQSKDGNTGVDGVKYLPVLYSDGECLARDLPFMSVLKGHCSVVRENYRHLLFDQSYAHFQLSDYFCIDHR